MAQWGLEFLKFLKIKIVTPGIIVRKRQRTGRNTGLKNTNKLIN